MSFQPLWPLQKQARPLEESGQFSDLSLGYPLLLRPVAPRVLVVSGLV